MVYTPGVARVCMAIHDDPTTVSPAHHQEEHGGGGDGRLGRAGPGEHRARRRRCRSWRARRRSSRSSPAWTPFRSAWIRRMPDEIVRDGEAHRARLRGDQSGGHLGPRCFEIEERLQKEVDIPVFHDDQHGTAVVVLAALLNALRIVKKIAAGAQDRGERHRRVRRGLHEDADGHGARNIIGVDTSGRPVPRPQREREPHQGAGTPGSPIPRNLKGSITGRDWRGGHVPRPVGTGNASRSRASRRWRRTLSSSPWPTRSPRSCRKRPHGTSG